MLSCVRLPHDEIQECLLGGNTAGGLSSTAHVMPACSLGVDVNCDHSSHQVSPL